MSAKAPSKKSTTKRDSTLPSGTPGIYYRESPVRRVTPKGSTKSRPEKCWIVKFYRNGKYTKETVGWESDVAWGDVLKRLGELQEGAETKLSLKKAREQAISINHFWDNTYKPNHENDPKCRKFFHHIDLRYEKYYRTTIGEKKLVEITRRDVDQFWADLNKTKLALATQIQVMTIFRQVINYADDLDIITGKSPFKRFTMPSVGKKNRRLAWFSPAQALDILRACANPPDKYSSLRDDPQDLHDAFLLSLWTGLRASEITKLMVIDFRAETSSLHLLDTKSGETVPISLRAEIASMLKGRVRGNSKPGDLLFPSFKGSYKSLSDRFRDVLDRLRIPMISDT